MPYVKHEASVEYVFEEYPKALTRVDERGMIVPDLYPARHEKQGLPIVFANAEEEEAHTGGKKAKKK